jgi:hypothetical protein
MAALPIVILVYMILDGNIFSGVLAIILWFVTAPIVRDMAGRGDAGSSLFVAGMQLAFIVACLWILKLAMMIGGVLFGWLVSTAEICTGGSALVSGLYWCATKKTEHSISERLLHVVARAASRHV